MSKKILVSILIMFGTAAYAADPTYSVVIDSGSTGNRVFVYEVEYVEGFPKVKMQELVNEKLEKLSYTNKFPLAGNSAEDAIQPLLIAAKTFLNTKQVNISNVPVSVLATAGMRILEEEDAVNRTTLVHDKYEKVKGIIAEEKFKVGEVGIIPGYDEGLYSWLDINYDQIKSNNKIKKNQGTKGIAEVGGASAQVAFNTSDTTVPSPFSNSPAIAKITNVTVNGVTYNIFSVSYLGLGQNMARKLMNGSIKNSLTNSCYFGGYTNPKEAAAFPDFLFNKYSFTPDQQFTVADGTTYNFAGCANNYQNVFSLSSFASLPQIKKINGFSSTSMGLASIYWKLENMGALGEQTASGLENKLIKLCTPEKLLERISSSKSDPELKKDPEKLAKRLAELDVQCADTTYVHEFLYGAKSLGIPDGQLSMTQQADQDLAKNATWTRGYAFYHEINKTYADTATHN